MGKGLRRLQRGDNWEIANIHRLYLKIQKNPKNPKKKKPFSTKVDTIHPRVKDVEICSNEGPRSFLRRYHCELAKVH